MHESLEPGWRVSALSIVNCVVHNVQKPAHISVSVTCHVYAHDMLLKLSTLQISSCITARLIMHGQRNTRISNESYRSRHSPHAHRPHTCISIFIRVLLATHEVQRPGSDTVSSRSTRVLRSSMLLL